MNSLIISVTTKNGFCDLGILDLKKLFKFQKIVGTSSPLFVGVLIWITIIIYMCVCLYTYDDIYVYE